MTASASEEALRALEETGRLDLAHVGVAARELGHIRVRLGDTEGAEQAFRRAHEYGISPEPAMRYVKPGDAAVAEVTSLLSPPRSSH